MMPKKFIEAGTSKVTPTLVLICGLRYVAIVSDGEWPKLEGRSRMGIWELITTALNLRSNPLSSNRTLAPGVRQPPGIKTELAFDY